MAESERRFEDIARKLATMEGELERSLDRCTSGKITTNGWTTVSYLSRSDELLLIKSDETIF